MVRKRALITDLDNTLYDWVTFFSKSFEAMVDEIERITEINRETLLDEFRSVHREYGNSEQPFAAIELPSIVAHFGTSDRAELAQALNPALHAFNSMRKRSLTLYPGVQNTLRQLAENDISLIGHTEAMVLNSLWRLRKLNIDKYFRRLYTLEGKWAMHPSGGGNDLLDQIDDFVETVPRNERKPNPELLIDICRREGFDIQEAVYVGDSLVRDVSMAKRANVTAVWAAYGTRYDKCLWDILVRVTHWTDEDVAREERLRHDFGNIMPDLSIERFEDVGLALGLPNA
jgi:phosphoglycolate phosphatase